MSVMNDGDPVVIFAGYRREMEAFVQANAGLFRRIDVRCVAQGGATRVLASPCWCREEVDEAASSAASACEVRGAVGGNVPTDQSVR